MSNDLISRSIAIDEFYSRVGGDLSISEVKYIETVLNVVPTACHVDMIIDKMDGIIQKYRKIGTPEECSEAVEAAHRHRNDGWISCSTGKMPYGGSAVLIKLKDGSGGVTGDDGMEFDISFVRDSNNKEWTSSCGTYLAEDVIAWRPISPYRPQRFVGEDYKQRIMDRFTRTE